MPPGWYDDPWSPTTLRWWDGTQWTSHVAPKLRTATGFLAPAGPADVERVAAAGRRASNALVVGALIACVEYFVIATFLHGFLHDLIHQIRVYNDQLNTDPYAQPQLHVHVPVGHIVAFYATGLAAFVVEIMIIVWLYQAATTAQRLGLPARRSPVWAILGFIVPVVNFWFPYQVAADLLPPGDARRGFAGAWWGWWLGQGFVAIPIVVVSFASTGVAVALAVAGCTVPIMAALKGREMIAAVSAGHAALVR